MCNLSKHRKFEFLASFGSETKKVIISAPSGSAQTFHIMINNFYNGSIHKTLNGWVVYFNNDQFGSADAEALLERLETLKALD